MRTTVDIDADVLQAAKEIAANRETTVGKLLSEWARQASEPKSKASSNVPSPLTSRVELAQEWSTIQAIDSKGLKSATHSVSRTD